MWKDVSFAPNWQVNEFGQVRRKIVNKIDRMKKYAIDGWYYANLRTSGSGYLCFGKKR